jgi:hypothetical protein
VTFLSHQELILTIIAAHLNWLRTSRVNAKTVASNVHVMNQTERPQSACPSELRLGPNLASNLSLKQKL